MSGAAIAFEPIGIIHSEHVAAERTPIQTTRNGWQDEVDEETARRRGRRVGP